MTYRSVVAWLVLLTAVGCSSSESIDANNVRLPVTVGADTARRRMDVSPALGALLDDPSIQKLSAILSEQHISLPKQAKLGCSNAWRNIQVDSPLEAGIVNSVSAVKSLGERYILAPVVTYKSTNDETPLATNQYWTDMLFVLSEQGRIISQLGGKWAPDGINGDEILITSLGTNDTWFVLSTRFEPHGQFEQITDIYIVGRTSPALRMFHDANNMQLTLSPNDVKFRRCSCIQFRGKNREMEDADKGIGSDRREHLPIIEWDKEYKEFKGPSSVSFRGRPIFEVDTKNSSSFEATDLGTP